MTILLLIKTAIFLWILFESIFLALLYKMAWTTMKRSQIIFSLHLIFLSLAITATVVSIFPIVNIVNPELHDKMFVLVPFPTLLLALSLRYFRIKSLEKDIPKKVIKIEKNGNKT